MSEKIYSVERVDDQQALQEAHYHLAGCMLGGGWETRRRCSPARISRERGGNHNTSGDTIKSTSKNNIVEINLEVYIAIAQVPTPSQVSDAPCSPFICAILNPL